MIAVIFEVEPAEGQQGPYLDMAAGMRPMAERVEGFISVERFQSLTNPEKLLSLSFFRDEAALDEWRQLTAHRAAQKKGREEHFADYRESFLMKLCRLLSGTWKWGLLLLSFTRYNSNLEH